MKTITVIGAGLSGTLLTMNLLRQNPNKEFKIYWIDRNPEEQMGPAYSTNEDYLLNVPVEMMGAYSEDPEHFLRWYRVHHGKVSNGDYLPRKLYRTYIQSQYNEALESKKGKITVERIHDEVMDIEPIDGHYILSTRSSGSIKSESVILALGNFPPPHPHTKNKEWLQSERYVQNPWQPDLLDRISPEDTILFIGTGQTMVDLANGLYRRNHKGRLIAVSRRGVLPLSQKNVEPYPSFYEEIKDQNDFTSVFHIVRKHIKRAESMGKDPRSVIDSLRPHTIAIWMSLPTEEKKRFLRHAFRYWEIIRSRIPPVSEEIIDELKSSGQLEIITGRLENVHITRDHVNIDIRQRNTGLVRMESAQWVINCRGANPDYEKIDDELVKNLRRRKLICCDPVHLGINATPWGKIILKDGKLYPNLYTLGPAMKGVVWESLATPEIRVQAENLAKVLLSS